jgi:hypothetical protein
MGLSRSMPASRSALRTVTVLTLVPVRRSNSRVTSSSDDRGCSCVIARSACTCDAFNEGLRPGRLDPCSFAFVTQHPASVRLDQRTMRETLFSSTSSERPMKKPG